MEQILPTAAQPEEPEKILLHVSEHAIEAYGVSAYILFKCFPHFISLMKEEKEGGTVCKGVMNSLDFLIGNKNFRMVVSDELIGLYIVNPILKQKLQLWAKDFLRIMEESTPS